MMLGRLASNDIVEGSLTTHGRASKNHTGPCPESLEFSAVGSLRDATISVVWNFLMSYSMPVFLLVIPSIFPEVNNQLLGFANIEQQFISVAQNF